MALCGPACAAFCRKAIFLFILLAIIFSFLAAFSCEFITYDHDGVTGTAGFWKNTDDSGECVAYDRDLDKSENFAQDASLIAPIAGCLALFVIFIKLSCPSCKGSRGMVNLCLLVAIISQGITFAFFNSDEFCDGDILQEIISQDPCKPGKGSALSILALFLYFFSMISFWCVPKTNQKEVDETGGGDEEQGSGKKKGGVMS